MMHDAAVSSGKVLTDDLLCGPPVCRPGTHLHTDSLVPMDSSHHRHSHLWRRSGERSEWA